MKLRPKNIIHIVNTKALPSKGKVKPNIKLVPKLTIPSLPETAPIPQKVISRNSKHPERWEAMYEPKQSFYINKHLTSSIDPITKRWIRNDSDERAAFDGMRFSEKRGQFVVDWVQTYCKLYEDSTFVRAGSPLLCDDWQYEYFMQLFGWLQHSEELSIMEHREVWIRRFTHAGIWIAKKNAKSPTLAATGLYMLIGDGEQGQKCYSVARDGKQAKIAHNHAIEMVKMSPHLLSECKINHTEGIIRHVPTKSVYSVVHGENSKSTEGFNGSLFCDETHVLEQTHMDRLKRAGISRREPLHVEVSTAGNNADGYGYNRYQYGKRIASVENKDDYNPHFLFIDFSIDQEVKMDQLRDAKFVEHLAPICNPALGRILRKEEFMQDWRDSCLSETELRQFAMYRLNLWLKDSATWIELADWVRCSESPLSRELGRQYTLEDLMPYPCVGGLDMSKTQDMTALSLIFAVPDEEVGTRLYTWTWHWLPQTTANKYTRFINFYDEKYKPFIHLIKQKTIEHEMIAKRLEWIRDNFDLRGVGYDQYNASDTLTYLMNEYSWSEEMLLKVPQQMRFMGPITKSMERWIIRQEVHHPDNNLLSWQFSHASLDTDRIGNYRIIKPEPKDYRKVDGIISLMIAGVTLCSDPTLWTETSNSILLFERETSGKTGKTDTVVPMHKGENEEKISDYEY